MILDVRTQSTPMSATCSSSIRSIRLDRPPVTEYFITVLPQANEPIRPLLAEVAQVLRESDARIVSQEVFAPAGVEGPASRAMAGTLGERRWPLTWIDPGGKHFVGTQIWAVSGGAVRPLAMDGEVVGSIFADRYATYCRLGGLQATHTPRQKMSQAHNVLQRMENALLTEGIDFTRTLRTWFYLDDILSWYGDFNRVRDGFFRTHGVFDRLVPASTGIGAANPRGSALTAGLLATRPTNGSVAVRALPSPLQCSALDYGSSFSRAVEMELPDHRRIFVSGTASIAPQGHTIHVGNVKAQIAKTVEVVGAILESREMAWSDVTRGIAYVREPADIPLYSHYCAGAGLPPMPVVTMQSTICRDDLLFELEVDAVKGP